MDIPDMYRNIFSIDYDVYLTNTYEKNRDLYKKFFNFVEPFAIYFPQFHAIEENDGTFYKGYTDMVNLQKAKKADPSSVEVPISDYLGYYDLKYDPHIIDRQILLAKAYGFKGFAIYYYWFSENTITGNNMVFKDAIDRFFKEQMSGFEVFFIYANESWRSNPGFNQKINTHLIRNNYSKKDMVKNFNNLITYFKHPNYKKINNKPIITLHQPWDMKVGDVDNFYEIGNRIAKENGFDGIEFVVNAMKDSYPKYKNYSHHPDYKNASNVMPIRERQVYIDYDRYINQFLPTVPCRSENLQMAFYSFDNTVRFFNHDNKQVYITKTMNNDSENFKKFLSDQIDTYKSNGKVGKIFFVNSWNEWGERMAIEPSNESGFTLLEAFKDAILKYVE